MKRREFLLGLSLAMTGVAAAGATKGSSNIEAEELFANPAEFVSLSKNIESMLPTAEESLWQTVPWRNNLMLARKEAQHVNKPLFLWIMNGNPMGCT